MTFELLLSGLHLHFKLIKLANLMDFSEWFNIFFFMYNTIFECEKN